MYFTFSNFLHRLVRYYWDQGLSTLGEFLSSTLEPTLPICSIMSWTVWLEGFGRKLRRTEPKTMRQSMQESIAVLPISDRLTGFHGRFHLSTIVFTKSWKTDFFSLVQVVPNL